MFKNIVELFLIFYYFLFMFSVNGHAKDFWELDGS